MAGWIPASAGMTVIRTPAPSARDALPGCGGWVSDGKSGGAQPLDPASDLFRAGFQRRTVDDEARADIGDVFDLNEAVGPQRRPGLHQIDDMPAQPEERGELNGAVQFDALGL